MYHRKVLLLVIILSLLTAACKSKKTGFVLTGKVNGLDTGKIYLTFMAGLDSSYIDSATLELGQFSFKGTVEEPRKARLVLKRDDFPSVDLFIENQEIVTELALTDTTFERVKFSGSPLTVEYDLLMLALKSPGERIAELSEKSEAAETNAEYDSLSELIEDSYAQINREMLEFAKSHPTSPVALALLAEAQFDPDNLDYYESFLKAVDPKLLTSLSGKKITRQVSTTKRTAVGQPAIEFILPDSVGTDHKLTEFYGGFLLVDFWASWCGPCRQESPNLVAAYKAYHGAGFEILSISIDQDDERWKRAIVADKYSWPNLIDQDGKVSDQYGVEAIPYNLLLDQPGKIIAKNLRGDELKATLDQYLKTN
jgi:peroxiredoxin